MNGPSEIAVLGCGGWGRNIVRTLEKLSLLRAVADTTPEGRALAANLAPQATIHDTLDSILEDPAIRGVMIATPAEFHYEHVCQTLAAGKDVFVEKPMTIDVDEARDLISRARQADRILMVGHLLEYHPAIRKLHDLILAGELGDLQYLISNRLNLGKIRTRENALWSFAPHDIAVILRLVGVLPLEIVATGGS
ncbi:MAG: Gfo/Idh/MocA family oxidoreductase, partial [Planctomycetes bacterium]|nr:Gfo/Idh/MocA family oxidoreductase [Planctomycetota bacterium]